MLADIRVRQRDYLLEISRAITQELDLDKLLGRILDISIEMVAGQSGLISLRSETKGWHIHVSHGLPSPFLRYLEPYLANIPPFPEDHENREIQEINRLFTELTHAASMGMLISVGLPLVTHNKILGVIFIFRGYPGVFSNNDRALLRSFADQAAIAVQNAQLYSEISHEKKRLDALLDSAADGILIVAPDHRIEHCNLALIRMLKLPNESIKNQKLENVIQWVSQPHGLTLEQAEAGGWPLTPHANLYTEGDLKRQDNLPTIPVGITYAPLLGSDGVLLNIIATVRDITRFRQADEIKTAFISIISHELKTPVALIKGYVGTLRREDATWDPEIIQDSFCLLYTSPSPRD